MKLINFRIKNCKIFFEDQSIFELLNLSDAVIQGENYYQVLSRYLNEETALFFKALVKSQQGSDYKRFFINNQSGELVPISLFGFRIDNEDESLVLGSIVETKEMEKELFGTLDDLSQMQYALNNSVILAITDTNGRITYANRHFCESSGYESHELIGRTHRVVNSGYHSKAFFKNMWDTIKQGKTWHGEVKNRKKDGSFYWADSTIVPMLDENGVPFQYMAIRYNITSQKKNEEQILRLANYDSLTGLANRRRFDEHLTECIEQAKEDHKKIGVLFIDLDGFKYVNDTMGHAIGDQLLVKVSNRLHQIVGEHGLVARLGGDEFSLVIYDIVGIDELRAIAEHLIEQFKSPFNVNDFAIRMTCSIGIAMFPESGDSFEAIMKNADSAMYHVKNTRKNDYMFSLNSEELSNQRLFQIQNGLRATNYEAEFYLVYQPKVDPRQQRINGLEALLRWKNKELGEISPAEFIPIAEEIGMLNQLNEWVLEQVCQQIQVWLKKGYQTLPVSVNLSASQFIHVDFASRFLGKLKKFSVPTEWIQVEITETVLINNEENVRRALRKLKNVGIEVALDDFGTGYSSLSYLIKLDLDMLKIDKSLIQGISDGFRERNVIKTVIQLGKNLGLKVVAEGIETKEELAIMIESGVDEIQGFYYSKPCRPEKVEEWLADSSRMITPLDQDESHK